MPTSSRMTAAVGEPALPHPGRERCGQAVGAGSPRVLVGRHVEALGPSLLDPAKHRVYLPAAQYGPAPAPTEATPRPRPPMLPGSFEVLVVGRP